MRPPEGHGVPEVKLGETVAQSCDGTQCGPIELDKAEEGLSNSRVWASRAIAPRMLAHMTSTHTRPEQVIPIVIAGSPET